MRSQKRLLRRDQDLALTVERRVRAAGEERDQQAGVISRRPQHVLRGAVVENELQRERAKRPAPRFRLSCARSELTARRLALCACV